ncbi:MAG: heme biosynthesis protein HemY [Pseudomonadota bacterium]|nr:heme biosynthesis protein HemY [Pseudomonadota bacterium]
MKWLLTFLILLALAVAAALAAGFSKGYVLLIYPPYKFEMALSFVMVALIFGGAALYGFIRLAAHTLGLPRQVHDYRLRRARNRARNAMDQALTAFFEGHYRRAEKFAAVALKLQETPALSAVVAARSAHEQRNFEARDNYLQAAEISAPEGKLLKLIAQAEFLVEERRPREALDVLEAAKVIAPRNPALLRLELRAHVLARNWEQVLTGVTQLHKFKDFDRKQLEPIRLNALRESMSATAKDSASLRETWRKIPSADRLDPGIAAGAARAFIAVNMADDAQLILERALDHQWDSELALLYAEVPGDKTLAQIERAEVWLRQHPDDASLLLSLGKLCAAEKLWGKAQSYIEASLSVEPSRAAHASYAQLMEKMGKPEEALRYNRRKR